MSAIEGLEANGFLVEGRAHHLKAILLERINALVISHRAPNLKCDSREPSTAFRPLHGVPPGYRDSKTLAGILDS